MTQTQPGPHLGRRLFLALVGTGAAATLAGGAISEVLGAASPASGFRIYTVAGIPRVSAPDWRLEVSGEVSETLSWGLAELLALGAVERRHDFRCVTGWVVRGCRWRGVPLAALLDAAGAPRSGSYAVNFRCFDGAYHESLTLAQARRPENLVAFELDGKRLSAEQGYPARLVVPSMYGYKGPKWLSRVDVAAEKQPGYWVLRGYDDDGWVGRSNGYG